jgi:hypothetical protein
LNESSDNAPCDLISRANQPLSPPFGHKPSQTIMQRHKDMVPIWDHDLLRRREKNEKWHPFELRNVHMIQGEGDVVGYVVA